MDNIRYRHLIAGAVFLLAIANLALGLALLDPFFLVRFVVGVVVAALVLRFDRWWAIIPALIIGVASLAETGFFVDALTRFDTAEFGFAWANIVLGIGIVVLSIADLASRRSRSSDRPTPSAIVQVAGAAAALLIAVAIASAIATVVGRDTVGADDREGALIVTYEDLDTDDTELTATTGEPVRIVIDNKDVAFHDFDLQKAGVHVELSARESKLVEFTIDEPGAYEYKCTVPGHSKMKGVLTIQ